MPGRIPVFDLDGTLLDSDAALVDAFVALGVDREAVTFGGVVGEECARLGVSVDDYVTAYDDTGARPFPGVEDLLARVGPWALCSNKHPRSAHAELRRLGWDPVVALFTDAFDGPKRLAPVLEALGRDAAAVVFVGDSIHDRAAAAEVGVPFGLAAWNPRARPAPGDVVLAQPSDVLRFLAEG